MDKHLVILENDNELSGDRHDYVSKFAEEYSGKITKLTSLRARTKEEIYTAVSTATDIAVQSTLSYGADAQLHSMVALLSKIQHPITIYIRYLGLLEESTQSFLLNELSPKELISIEHHKVYDFHDQYIWDDGDFIAVDFSSVINPYREEQAREKQIKVDAQFKPTGRRVKVLACNAYGEPFKNLPLGEIVDVIDYTYKDDKPERGVWIWGNGEPIKLVNDCGMAEYDVQIESKEDVLFSIKSSIPQLQHKFTPNEQKAFDELFDFVVNNKELPSTIANIICDEYDIEKRYNRSMIASKLSELKNITVI